MIELKLANGKVYRGNSGEEAFWFHQSEGKSIVPPPPVKDKIVNRPPGGKVVVIPPLHSAPKGWESVETSNPS